MKKKIPENCEGTEQLRFLKIDGRNDSKTDVLRISKILVLQCFLWYAYLCLRKRHKKKFFGKG